MSSATNAITNAATALSSPIVRATPMKTCGNMYTSINTATADPMSTPMTLDFLQHCHSSMYYLCRLCMWQYRIILQYLTRM